MSASLYPAGQEQIGSLTGSEQIAVDGGGATKAFVTSAQLSNYAAQSGTFTANGATAVVVTDARVTANSVVVITLKTVGGTPDGAPYLSSVTPGTGFEVKAAAGDTSVYNYAIIN